jgi:NAD(P)-dependent dehydrogenase (short-subunit alcohol dehydrogenase family)
MNRFEGKLAVITGAARGIGLATAKMISSQGGDVALIDLDHAQAQSAAAAVAAGSGRRTAGFAADVSNLASVGQALQAIQAQLGAPNLLIHCAAITDDKLFLDSKPEDWQRIISVDLYGTLHCLHTFLPGMVERGYGRIVCMASDSARIGQARLSYYAAAKAGVIALVKSVAQEVGRSGVTINVVSPGATNTEMRIAREAGLLEQMGPEKYERRQKTVLKMYPAGRIGRPDDIAGGIAFLCSDEAAWVTGQVLSVNGGFCMP